LVRQIGTVDASTQRRRTGRLQANGTFMAHKSGKGCSPVSASVNEPRTKQRIANILNGYRQFF